jgi:DnaA family protein
MNTQEVRFIMKMRHQGDIAMLFSPQIPLQLEPSRSDRFEDYVTGPNQNTLLAVQQLLDDPGGSLFLSGPEGSGKSHLLNALCHAAREKGLGAFYIALQHLPDEAAAGLDGLRGLDLVCVDDLDSVAGKPLWEQALFRCFDEVRATNGRLAISSRLSLSSLQFNLPDLQSRLTWGLRMSLRLPDDDGKLQVLQRRALALGIELPRDVQRYLIKHSKRDMGSLLSMLEQLRNAAFVAKRRITVPLAREILSSKR